MNKLTVLFYLATTLVGFSQAPIADFSVQSLACKNENILLSNLSVNADRYEWDICQGDLSLNPTGSTIGTLTGSNIPLGIDVIFDGTTWFGFVTSRNSNSIIRYTFDPSLNSITSITDLGNVGGLFNQPVAIKVVTDNEKWYGFVSNQSTSLSTSLITRIDFGEDLSNNSPSTISVITDITFAADGGLDIVYSESIWYLLFNQISLGPSYRTGIVKLNTIESVPLPSEILFISYSGTPALHDIKILMQSGTHHAYVIADSPSKLFHIDFGIDLYTTPIPMDISNVLPENITPFGIDGGYDNGNYYLLISSDGGNISRNNLGSDLSQNPIIMGESLGNLGLFSNTRKVRLLKYETSWHAFSVNYFTGSIYKASFPSPVCADPIGFFLDENLQLSFTSEGTKAISLRSFKGGEYSENHTVVTINSLTSPSINIISNGVCFGSYTNFLFQSDQIITSNNWNFGDLNSSLFQYPNHQYDATGTYTVRLDVQSTNGCNNFTEKTIKIYTPPSASFTLPTGLICTNNEFTFTNNTVDNFDGNLSFQWLLDDIPVSTQDDLLYTFTTGGDKELTLQASIPGCTSESVQVLSGVGEGPTVDFTIGGTCLNESVQLTNNSQGAIAGYTWNFGDGQSSNDTSPIVNYAAAGNYTIELQTLGTNGCLSTKSLPHQIYSVPVPNFNTDLPPFSCNGTPTQFNDLTPPLTDSNINTWQWSFDDQNASASSQNPQHTYVLSGNYNVSLTVTSDQLCAATLNKTISIAQSPTPSITNTAACVETAVVLQETATTTANAWQWQIGNNFYFTASPSHVFSNPGTYQVSLTLTASNGCVGTTTKQINVPAPLAIDFESALNCVNTPTQFTSLVNDDLDPVLTYNWNFGTEQKNGPVVNFLYNQSGIKEVQLTALATSGCFYTITKAIDILPEPKADFSFTPSSGPPPLVISFTNESTDANTFAWKFNDLNNTISNLNNPSFTFTEVGEYAVDLTAYNTVGCESTVSKLITIAFPFLNATLDNFRIVRNTDGSYLLLTNILNNGNVLVQNPLIEIQLDNTTTLQEIVNRSILPGGLIDYTFATQISSVSNLNYACIRLVLPNNEALNNTEACLTFNATSALTSPYPNPASNSITVEWISPEDEQVAMTVVDNLGNVMATENISSKQGLNTLVLQTMDWQAGIYFIRLKSPSKAHYFRTIIAR